eukprot:5880485-Alexandrium_andersonii.AAC.1
MPRRAAPLPPHLSLPPAPGLDRQPDFDPRAQLNSDETKRRATRMPPTDPCIKLLSCARQLMHEPHHTHQMPTAAFLLQSKSHTKFAEG